MCARARCRGSSAGLGRPGLRRACGCWRQARRRRQPGRRRGARPAERLQGRRRAQQQPAPRLYSGSSTALCWEGARRRRSRARCRQRRRRYEAQQAAGGRAAGAGQAAKDLEAPHLTRTTAGPWPGLPWSAARCVQGAARPYGCPGRACRILTLPPIHQQRRSALWRPAYQQCSAHAAALTSTLKTQSAHGSNQIAAF